MHALMYDQKLLPTQFLQRWQLVIMPDHMTAYNSVQLVSVALVFSLYSPEMTASERGIIDKMAEYVTRNGPEFEELVTRQKGSDPRFGFLKPTHPLHAYYQSRKQITCKDKPEPEVSVRNAEETTQCSEIDRNMGHLNVHQNGRLPSGRVKTLSGLNWFNSFLIILTLYMRKHQRIPWIYVYCLIRRVTHVWPWFSK